MQHAAQRKPGRGRRCHQPLRGVRVGDVTELHHHVGADRTDEFDCLQGLFGGLGAGAEDDPACAGATIRRSHLLGQEEPETTQAAGDDVGAVASEDRCLLGWQHHAAAPGLRDVEDELAGVLGRAHHPNRGGRVGKRVMRAFGHRQHALGGQPIHRAQQLADLLGMADRHHSQVDAPEREVATEREEAELGVAVDVALADLHEPSAQRQQFEPGQLRGTGNRVEHDVDAIAVGVASDLLGEFDAAGVVDMLDAHAAQQVATLLAAGGGEDVGEAPLARAMAIAAWPTPPVPE